MTLAQYLESKNVLANEVLQNERTYYASIGRKEDLGKKLYHELNEKIFPHQESIYNSLIRILFHELFNPFTPKIELNVTLLLSISTSLTFFICSIIIFCQSVGYIGQMFTELFQGNLSKIPETFLEFGSSFLASFCAFLAFLVILTVSLLAAALSLVTRPLATLYYSAEYTGKYLVEQYPSSTPKMA